MMHIIGKHSYESINAADYMPIVYVKQIIRMLWATNRHKIGTRTTHQKNG